MAMNIRGAGDCSLEKVENEGCCMIFDSIGPTTPRLLIPYGLVGTIAGHRTPKKPMVTKIPITPRIDVGANAANDDKRHSGSTILPVNNNIEACRDCKKLDNIDDNDATTVG